ncbi:hypothetical protein [Desulfoplanes sp.]
MRVLPPVLTTLLLAALCLSGGGCAKSSKPCGVPFHEQELYNYYLGKHYMGRGRLELARQRFAMARDASSDPAFKSRCSREINVLTAMITTRRHPDHAQ